MSSDKAATAIVASHQPVDRSLLAVRKGDRIVDVGAQVGLLPQDDDRGAITGHRIGGRAGQLVTANVGERGDLALGRDGDVQAIAVCPRLGAQHGEGSEAGIIHDIGAIGGVHRNELHLARLDRRDVVGRVLIFPQLDVFAGCFGQGRRQCLPIDRLDVGIGIDVMGQDQRGRIGDVFRIAGGIGQQVFVVVGILWSQMFLRRLDQAAHDGERIGRRPHHFPSLHGAVGAITHHDQGDGDSRIGHSAKQTSQDAAWSGAAPADDEFAAG